MKTTTLLAILIAGVILTAGLALQSMAAASCDYKGCSWLATGTVTRVADSTFYLLGRDNQTYAIEAGASEFLRGESSVTRQTLQVGDPVRVYGTVVDATTIRASRVRLLTEPASVSGAGPKPEVKIIVEKPSAPPEGGQRTPPAPIVLGPSNWEDRGLVTDVDYSGNTVKVRTANAQFTINVANALLVRGNRRIGLGTLSIGDAVSIRGNISGLNKVDAQVLELTRTRSEAEAALPQNPVSVAGTIQQIDYPSFTFTMSTQSVPIVVLAGPNTVVQSEMRREAFMDLTPGMRVKMTGYGSLGSGYAAKHIQIIGLSP